MADEAMKMRVSSISWYRSWKRKREQTLNHVIVKNKGSVMAFSVRNVLMAP